MSIIRNVDLQCERSFSVIFADAREEQENEMRMDTNSKKAVFGSYHKLFFTLYSISEIYLQAPRRRNQ